MILVILLVLVTACYTGLLAAFIYGWKKLPDFELKKEIPKTSFSIIIPYRNEAENLPELFKSLSGLRYPSELYEIILVNDESEDDSLKLCEEFQESFPGLKIKLIENKRRTTSPKKDAVLTGIDQARFEYIVTTDADCIVPVKWLAGFDQQIQENDTKLIAGPVGFIGSADVRAKLFTRFEELDFLSLQATTIGSFGIEKGFMCNAANLGYSKSVFEKYNGYEGNEEIASGDDVFLLQKLNKAGEKVAFLKSPELIVQTRFQKSLRALIHQRLRWASKTSSFISKLAKFTGIIVFLMNFMLIFGAVMAFLGYTDYQYVLMAFLVKFNIDFIILYRAAKFFKREEILRSYLWGSIVYPFYTIYISILAMLTDYEWKGRRFNM
ncbi:glycosyltransferase [Gramella sp. GC03-9]|uniref:Glycosyltransferase n=1 Tax=Christiangramia oceanisediminis TaxID=2920386 RepID=A0A9X2KW04_9FLAO|nr:glycosyltransferase [Gramella oceanisediminis]MCP9198779.1 glycosyltransferase [Gramella oceanisediminis]